MTESANTIKKLQQKWLKREDTIGKRLVGKILQLHDKSDPILESILNDDVAAFKLAYKKNQESLPLVFWFDVACICGSEAIVSSLLDDARFDINTSEEAIGFALSTGKFDFALKLAQLAKEKGKKDPGNIYLYNACDFSDLKKIASMFHNSKNER